jgi:hypothetical protein
MDNRDLDSYEIWLFVVSMNYIILFSEHFCRFVLYQIILQKFMKEVYKQLFDSYFCSKMLSVNMKALVYRRALSLLFCLLHRPKQAEESCREYLWL